MDKIIRHMLRSHWVLGTRKNSGNHIAASHSLQPLVKGERLVRYEVNAVIPWHCATGAIYNTLQEWRFGALAQSCTSALPTLLPRWGFPGVEPCLRNIGNNFQLGAYQLPLRSRQNTQLKNRRNKRQTGNSVLHIHPSTAKSWSHRDEV